MCKIAGLIRRPGIPACGSGTGGTPNVAQAWAPDAPRRRNTNKVLRKSKGSCLSCEANALCLDAAGAIQDHATQSDPFTMAPHAAPKQDPSWVQIVATMQPGRAWLPVQVSSAAHATTMAAPLLSRHRRRASLSRQHHCPVSSCLFITSLQELQQRRLLVHDHCQRCRRLPKPP